MGLADRMRRAKADGSAERNWGIAALADLLDSYPVITAAVPYLNSIHSGHYNDNLQGLSDQRPSFKHVGPEFSIFPLCRVPLYRTCLGRQS
jgi:hypothetical protein